MALATKTADEVGANLILASDPDADRLAVAERNKDGSWHLFNGNDIGALLGHWQWEKFTEVGTLPLCFTLHTTHRACCSALVGLLQANARAPPAEQVPASDVYMMAPAVASKMLAAMAKHHGFNFEETLTGFKWAGNKVLCCTRRGIAKGVAAMVELTTLVGRCIARRTPCGVRAKPSCSRTSQRSGSVSATYVKVAVVPTPPHAHVLRCVAVGLSWTCRHRL